jgi:hypothetical protein
MCVGSLKALEVVNFQRIIQKILMSFTCVVLYVPQVSAKHVNSVAVFLLTYACWICTTCIIELMVTCGLVNKVFLFCSWY